MLASEKAKKNSQNSDIQKKKEQLLKMEEEKKD